MYSFGAGLRGDFDAGTMETWQQQPRNDRTGAETSYDPIRELWQQSMALREQSRQARAVSHELRTISRSIRDTIDGRARELRR